MTDKQKPPDRGRELLNSSRHVWGEARALETFQKLKHNSYRRKH